jgi:hypothetical protein
MAVDEYYDDVNGYNDTIVSTIFRTSGGNATKDLGCPVFDDDILELLKFWLEGVVQCAIAILGLIGNIISAVILSR